MRIVVDKQKCISALPCLAIARKTFQLDKEGKAELKDNSEDDEETILLAARSCPVKAILLYDDEGNNIFPGTEFDEEDNTF